MKKTFTLIAAFGIVLLAGCSRTDFTTDVKDTRGVTVQSPVSHDTKRVGVVEKVVPSQTGFRLEVRLDDQYRKTFREGLMACPVKSGKLSPVPALILVAGDDTSAPLLKRGARIPEIPLSLLEPEPPPETPVDSSRWGTVKTPLTICLTVLPLVVLVLKLLKGFFKVVLLGILILALVYGVYGVKRGWTLDKIPFPTDKARAWLLENKEFVIGVAGTLSTQIGEGIGK